MADTPTPDNFDPNFNEALPLENMSDFMSRINSDASSLLPRERTITQEEVTQALNYEQPALNFNMAKLAERAQLTERAASASKQNFDALRAITEGYNALAYLETSNMVDLDVLSRARLTIIQVVQAFNTRMDQYRAANGDPPAPRGPQPR